MDKLNVSAIVAGNTIQWFQGPGDFRVVVEVLCANRKLERVHDDEDRVLPLGCAFELRNSVDGTGTNDQLQGFFTGRTHRPEVVPDLASLFLKCEVEDRPWRGLPA